MHPFWTTPLSVSVTAHLTALVDETTTVLEATRVRALLGSTGLPGREACRVLREVFGAWSREHGDPEEHTLHLLVERAGADDDALVWTLTTDPAAARSPHLVRSMAATLSSPVRSAVRHGLGLAHRH